jgi:hypothetical protein
VTDYPFTNIAGGQDWDQSLSGAGVLDGMAQTVKSFQNWDGVSIGANLLSSAIDVLGFIENPVKSVGVTAIGWLIEHLTALDIFLDRTTGDPQAVQNAAETFYRAAQSLDGLAADQIKSFGTDVDTFRSAQSPSAVAFEKRIGPRGDELRALSLQCQGLGEAVNTAGLLVATCRGVIRDTLTEFTYWILKKGVIALAAAPYTGGGSLTALLTDTCLAGAKLARRLADQLGSLAKDLKEVSRVLDTLEKLSKPLGNTWRHAAAVSLGRNYATAGAKALDDANTDLTAADSAEQQVAAHEEAERSKDPNHPLVPYPPGPVTTPPPPSKPQGPGLGARWTTSGTLDE